MLKGSLAFLARLIIGAFAAAVLGCNQRADRLPVGPSATATPATASTTFPAGSGITTLSWACLTGDTHQSGFSSGGWTVKRDPCPPAATRMSTAAVSVQPDFAPAPNNLRAVVSGSTVQLTWDQPPVAFAWQLEAGSALGLSNLAIFRTTAGTSLVVAGVPPGTYYVRVRSATPDFSDISAPSNEAAVIVGGCTSAPAPPTGFNVSVVANDVTFSWNPPSGAAATSYVLNVGSSSGQSNVLVFDTGSASTTVQFVAAPNGTYFVRLQAKNPCGISGASNEIVVTLGPPVAAFRLGSGSIAQRTCFSGGCVFDATSSTGTGLTYFWDFGDGKTATGPIVTHAYGRPATLTTYTARLTVTDAFGRTSTATKVIEVSPNY